MRRYRLYLTIVLVVASTSLSIAQMRLDSCQEKARRNYPLIKEYELIEASKEYSLSNAGKAYLPQFDVTIIGGVIEGFPTISLPGSPPAESETQLQLISVLQLNQVIWDGGITKARKGIIEANAGMEEANLEVNLYALEERVNNLFFGILLIDEQVKQLEVLESTLERNKQRVQNAVELGTAFKSDVDEINVEVINTKQKIGELSHARIAYINVLAAMIGEPINPEATFVQPQLSPDFRLASVNRPELDLLTNRYALIEAQARIDKAALYPKFGVMGFATLIQPGVEFGTSTVNNILVGGLSLNWSIGSLYQNNNKKKLTEVNLQKVTLQREAFLFNTNLSLKQIGGELDKYTTLIEQDRELLNLKTSIKEAYKVKYDNGIATLSQYLDRVNDESVAQQKLLVHEIEYLMKAYQYKNQTGN